MPAAIEKLELSETGTHLNTVAGGKAEAMGPTIEKVKRAMDDAADAAYVQASPAKSTNVPEQTGDPWNTESGAWNQGKGTQPYGSSKRRSERRKSKGKSPTRRRKLPMKQLERRARSDMEIERDAVVATLASRASWHAVDEHGNAAAWGQMSSRRDKSLLANANRSLNDTTADWKQHLEDAKNESRQRRLKNLDGVRAYNEEVQRRPTGSIVVHQVEQLIKQQKAELHRQHEEQRERERQLLQNAADSMDHAHFTLKAAAPATPPRTKKILAQAKALLDNQRGDGPALPECPGPFRKKVDPLLRTMQLEVEAKKERYGELAQLILEGNASAEENEEAETLLAELLASGDATDGKPEPR